MPATPERLLRSLLWSLPVATAVIWVEFVRQSGGTPAVPFLLIYMTVILSTLGGRLAGGIAGGIGAGFIIYSARIGFGRVYLTGALPQAALGCFLLIASGLVLGHRTDQLTRLVRELTESRDDLEEIVRRRTQALEQSNRELRSEAHERELMTRELVEFESRLRHSQRLESIGVLAGGIAHDFNNLLTSIRANTSLLRRAEADSVRLELLGDVENASVRAAELCDQMLSYAGEARDVRTTIDLVPLLSETVGFVSASISKKVRLEVEGEVSLCVHADASQIGQVMLNLLTNAAEAIEGDGQVRVRLGIVTLSKSELAEYLLGIDLEPGHYAQILVADDGVGIAADKLQSIFDPFFSTKFAGRGLGLSVVFGVARSHGGAIRIESDPGRGTRIAFILPYDTALEGEVRSQVPVLPVRGTTAPAQPGATILITDDEPMIRRILRRILQIEGWTVAEAATGSEAVEACLSNPNICLALVDLTMPGMDGLETIEALSKAAPNVPAILMSGYSSDVAASSTARAFLAKPYDSEQVLTCVRDNAGDPPAKNA